MFQIFKASNSNTTENRFFIEITAIDGTPALEEEGETPQISIDGGDYADTTNQLVAVRDASSDSFGLYYVELTALEIVNAGKVFLRYKSTNTEECRSYGIIVSYDPLSGARTLTAAERSNLVDRFAEEPLTDAAAAAPTWAGALSASWAQAFGDWSITDGVLSLYGPEGAVVCVFNLNSPTEPTSRTRVVE